MKRTFFIIFILIQCARSSSQDSNYVPAFKKHILVIHFYPSALVGGDMSCGLELRNKKKFSMEFASNFKLFTPAIYHYNKGYRLNSLIKYDLSYTPDFRFSVGVSTMFMNIYFKNKNIDYYYYELSSQNSASYPYLTLKEDRRLLEYGAGLGVSMQVRIYKKIFAGSDLVFNYVKTRTTYTINDLVKGNVDNYPYGSISLPCTFEIESQGLKLAPYLTMKLSYQLNRND